MKTFIVIASALFGLLLVASPVFAGFRVSPDIINFQVKAGANALPTVVVGNETSAPEDFTVQLAGYGQSPDGSTQVLDSDSNPLSAVGIITPTPLQLHVDPGGTQKVQLNAVIPQGADGGRYAVLLLVTNPSGQGSVGSVTRLGVPILLTIGGSNLVETGAATMKPPANGSSVGSILLTVNYANSGNIHYRVKASFTVSAADGMPAGTSATDATMVLPGYSRDLSVNWTPQAVLSPGSYSISARVTLEDGTVLGQATAQFELPPPVPSTPPASPTPTPSYTPTQAPSSSTTPVVSSPPVTPAQPGKTNWGLIIGGIGGAGALAVGMFLFGVRRGRRGR